MNKKKGPIAAGKSKKGGGRPVPGPARGRLGGGGGGRWEGIVR